MSSHDLSFRDIGGIFARTFPRPTFEDVLEAIAGTSARLIQLNLSSAGMPTLPIRIEPDQAADIARKLKESHLRVVALSGTFNMIDPDIETRRENLRRLDVVSEAARGLGCPVVTLCTGTRDPNDIWKHHPENDDPSAWLNLVESMRDAVATAEFQELTFAFEPEIGNVVNSAAKARRLLDEIGSPCLKVVLDIANLIRPEELSRMDAIIDEAFDLLAPDIALVHAKEIAADGSVGEIEPGKGVLNFDRIFRRYLDAKLDVPVILHGLPEAAAAPAFRHVARRYTFVKGTRTFDHDGLAFHYLDIGEGLPFVFQHGLGGDSSKILDLMTEKPGFRLLSFDARYHGRTRPLGPVEKIGFDQSTDDLLALLDHLKIERAVIGGLSMGAGIALNFAIHHPERTLALILSRPAWLDQPLPENLRVFPEIAALIQSLGANAGRVAFEKTETFAKVLAESSDAAATLLGMFDDPTSIETAEKFRRIPQSCPAPNRHDWSSVAVPTLVLANYQDPIHPYEMGPALAAAFPRGEFGILEPKCVSIVTHEHDFNSQIHGFLNRHFPGGKVPPSTP